MGTLRGREVRPGLSELPAPVMNPLIDHRAIHAAGLLAGLADLAGVVAGEERAHDELTGLDGVDVAADLLDDAGVFVAHRGRPVDRLDAAR